MENIKYYIEETDAFIEGVEKHLRSGQKKHIVKIASFLKELEQNPLTGTGKPEELKGYGDRSVYSRRIDQKHRLVYEIFEVEKVVKILACYGHYEEN